jgi:hypothetical protein
MKKLLLILSLSAALFAADGDREKTPSPSCQEMAKLQAIVDADPDSAAVLFLQAAKEACKKEKGE